MSGSAPLACTAAVSPSADAAGCRVPVRCLQASASGRRGPVCAEAARSAAVSTVTRHGPVCVCRAERGALCTFRGHAHWFCLHIPRSCVRREPPQWGEAGRGSGGNMEPGP